MLGEPLADIELPTMHNGHVSVKEAVLPFARFAGADSVLGPEMKSTGEVMGIAGDFPTAFGKAQAAAGITLPTEGTVFITVTDNDKAAATQLATRFHDLGFEIIATKGTAQAISRMGIPVRAINKIVDGSPHVVDFIRNREVDLVINTPTGSGARSDGYEIRNAAVRNGIPCLTTMTGASAAARDLRGARAWGGAAVAPGAPREGPQSAVRSPQTRGRDRARLAPFGRRRCEVVANEASGGYRVVSAMDTSGPPPRAGQFYMLAADGWGGPNGRPYLPRAFAVAEAEAGPEGVRLDFLLEAVGPGTERLEALALGAGLRHRPARAAVLLPGGPLARGRGRDPGRRRDRGRDVGASAARALRAGPSGSCSAFAIVPTRAGWISFAARRCGRRPRTATGHQGYVTDLLAVLLEG